MPQNACTGNDVFYALDEQRARICRDLHDLTAQQIILIKLQLERIRKDSGLTSGSVQLDRVIRDVDRLAESLQAAVSGLRPAALGHDGLAGALQDLAINWSYRSGIASTVDLRSDTRTIDADVASALYHVAQEALTNIAKHAATASRVAVMLQDVEACIVLSVANDGIGFAVQDLPRVTGHFGLIGLRERVALVGGSLEIASGRDSGTTIVACIPRKAEHHE